MSTLIGQCCPNIWSITILGVRKVFWMRLAIQSVNFELLIKPIDLPYICRNYPISRWFKEHNGVPSGYRKFSLLTAFRLEWQHLDWWIILSLSVDSFVSIITWANCWNKDLPLLSFPSLYSPLQCLYIDTYISLILFSWRALTTLSIIY